MKQKKISTYAEICAEAEKYFINPRYIPERGSKRSNYPTRISNFKTENKKSINNFDLYLNLFGFPKTQFSAVQWVMNSTRLTGSDRLVAITIAHFYNETYGYAYPAISQISSITGLSRSAVSNSIKRMKLSGEWLVVQMQSSPYEGAMASRYYPLPPLGFGLVAKLAHENNVSGLKLTDLNDSMVYRKGFLKSNNQLTFIQAYREEIKKFSGAGKNKGKSILNTQGIKLDKKYDDILFVANKVFKVPRTTIFLGNSDKEKLSSYRSFMRVLKKGSVENNE